MGYGEMFKCSKCGNEYDVCLGIGFLHPDVCREELKKIKKGKYGEDWKKLALSEEYTVVDTENFVYICGKCGHWVNENAVSLYAPKDAAKLKKKKYGIKTVEEWGEVPYIMDPKDFRLLKRKVHKCSKCGELMHKATPEEIDNLPCPKCGGEKMKDYGNSFYWD